MSAVLSKLYPILGLMLVQKFGKLNNQSHASFPFQRGKNMNGLILINNRFLHGFVNFSIDNVGFLKNHKVLRYVWMDGIREKEKEMVSEERKRKKRKKKIFIIFVIQMVKSKKERKL